MKETAQKLFFNDNIKKSVAVLLLVLSPLMRSLSKQRYVRGHWGEKRLAHPWTTVVSIAWSLLLTFFCM